MFLRKDVYSFLQTREWTASPTLFHTSIILYEYITPFPKLQGFLSLFINIFENHRRVTAPNGICCRQSLSAHAEASKKSEYYEIYVPTVLDKTLNIMYYNCIIILS